MTQSFCRKRMRGDGDEESNEFTPLSKRINNIHLNNTLLTAETHCNNPHESLDSLCQHSNHINGGINLLHEANQWNGGLLVSDVNQLRSNVNINGRDMNDGNTNSLQADVPHQLQQQPLVLQYNPDLSPSENPYYYENNRLLYTLYMERLQRTNTCNYIIN